MTVAAKRGLRRPATRLLTVQGGIEPPVCLALQWRHVRSGLPRCVD